MEQVQAAPFDFAEVARTIQAQIRRLESLIYAIDDATDFSTKDPNEEILARLGRMVDYIHLCQDIAPAARQLAEQIEIAAQQEGRR